MNDLKLSDRQKKYNEDRSNARLSDPNSLIRRRQEMNLSLRKEKLFDSILEKRLKIQKERQIAVLNKNSSNVDGGLFLEIEVKVLEIPKILIQNYEKSSDKLVIISKILNQKIIDDEIDQDEQARRFAIRKLRDYLSDNGDDELSVDEGDLIYLNIYPHLENMLMRGLSMDKETLSDLRLLYEVTWVLIDLSSNYSKIVEKLLNVDVLKRMECLIEECVMINHKMGIDTSALVKHTFWIFSNILIQDEESNRIVKNTVDLRKHINSFLTGQVLNNASSREIHLLILTLLWTIQNFVSFHSTQIMHKYNDLLTSVMIITQVANTSEGTLDILQEAIYTLNKFSRCEDLIDELLKQQIVPNLITAFEIVSRENNPRVHTDIHNILTIMTELLAGDDNQITFVTMYPVIEKFIEILNNIDQRTGTMQIEEDSLYQRDSLVVKEVCLPLANICASTQSSVEKVFSNKMLVDLLYSIYNKFGDDVKYEILFIFYNAFFRGSNYTRSELVMKEVPRVFMNRLEILTGSQTKNHSHIALVLRGLRIFLKYGKKLSSKMNVIKSEFENENLPNMLEKLVYDSHPEVYGEATHLLQKYWGDSDNFYEGPSDLMY